MLPDDIGAEIDDVLVVKTEKYTLCHRLASLMGTNVEITNVIWLAGARQVHCGVRVHFATLALPYQQDRLRRLLCLGLRVRRLLAGAEVLANLHR